MHLNIKERIAIYKFDREKGHCKIGSFIFKNLFSTINQIVFILHPLCFKLTIFCSKFSVFFDSDKPRNNCCTIILHGLQLLEIVMK